MIDTRTEEDIERDRRVHKRPAYGSNIPQARNDLLQIAKEMRVDGLSEYAKRIEEVVMGKMHQNKPFQRTRKKSATTTEEVKAQVRSYIGSGLSAQEVAVKCGTNSGRVSEIWNGLR